MYFKLNDQKNLKKNLKYVFASWAGAVKYTDSISTEE